MEADPEFWEGLNAEKIGAGLREATCINEQDRLDLYVVLDRLPENEVVQERPNQRFILHFCEPGGVTEPAHTIEALEPIGALSLIPGSDEAQAGDISGALAYEVPGNIIYNAPAVLVLSQKGASTTSGGIAGFRWTKHHAKTLRALNVLLVLIQAWNMEARAQVIPEVKEKRRGRPPKCGPMVSPSVSLTRSLVRGGFNRLSQGGGSHVSATDIYHRVRDRGFVGTRVSRHSLSAYLYGKEFPPFHALGILSEVLDLDFKLLMAAWFVEKNGGAELAHLSKMIFA